MSGDSRPNLSAALQKQVDDARAVLHVGYPAWLRPFLAKGVVAITLGRHIYILPAFLLRPPREVERLIRHELVHVRQVARHTLPGFLVRYGWEFARHFVSERSFDKAYRRISFEVEAYAAEEGEG